MYKIYPPITPSVVPSSSSFDRQTLLTIVILGMIVVWASHHRAMTTTMLTNSHPCPFQPSKAANTHHQPDTTVYN